MPGSYVNSGTPNSSTSAAATATLPGSRTNGNTLIAHVHTTGGAISFSIGTTGWTMIDQQTQGAGNSACIAVCVVDGTEVDPVFTNSFTTWECQVHQWTGMLPSPIGNKTKATGFSTTLAVGAVTTSADNSTIAAILSCGLTSQIATPTNYTLRNHNETASFADLVADEVVATSGSSSDAVSITQSLSAWAGFLVELLYNDPIKHGTAVLAGTGTLADSAQRYAVASASLVALGQIAADTNTNLMTAQFDGRGQMIASATTNAVHVALAGAGAISVNAHLDSSVVTGAAVLLTGL